MTRLWVRFQTSQQRNCGVNYGKHFVLNKCLAQDFLLITLQKNLPCAVVYWIDLVKN